MKPPRLDDYQQFLAFYQQSIKSEKTVSLEFPLQKVFTMLVQPSPFNSRLPGTFVEAARRYLQRKPDALRHFRDPEVQQFFLSDLHDYIQLKALQARRTRKRPKN